MSESYYQFSVSIDQLTKKEATWLGELLNKKDVTTHQLAKKLEIPQDELCLWVPFPNFDWSFSPDGKALECWSEETGDLMQVARIAHAMMKRFNKKGHYKLTGSATCSKMHEGQFGGDTVWVSSSAILTSGEIEAALDECFEKPGSHVIIKNGRVRRITPAKPGGRQ